MGAEGQIIPGLHFCSECTVFPKGDLFFYFFCSIKAIDDVWLKEFSIRAITL